VEIQSQPGSGTVFRVYLPAEAGAGAPVADEVPEALPVDWKGHGLVLVADDEPGIRDFARRVLERAGFEVLLAADGVEAVEHVRAHQAELRLVMLDLTMPRQGGNESLAEMRIMGFRGPALRWSGYARAGEGTGPGGIFLRKPFNAEDLLAAVWKALG
jgi:CheY-like chemotaxis protein